LGYERFNESLAGLFFLSSWTKKPSPQVRKDAHVMGEGPVSSPSMSFILRVSQSSPAYVHNNAMDDLARFGRIVGCLLDVL
jgi:hypothetical protein